MQLVLKAQAFGTPRSLDDIFTQSNSLEFDNICSKVDTLSRILGEFKTQLSWSCSNLEFLC